MSLKDELKLGENINITKKSIVHLMFIGDYILNEVNSVLKPYQLSNQQYNVLRILRGQKGASVSLADIQSRMIHKNSNTTRLIDKLVTKRLVSKKTDPKNRRKVKIAISQAGLDVLVTLDPIIETIENQMMKHLSETEHKTLNDFLERLRLNK